MQFTPQRIDKVHRVMHREEIDALLVTHREDVQYLTGYQFRGVDGPIGCLITENNQPQLLLSDRQGPVSNREPVMAKVKPFKETRFADWSGTGGAGFWDQITSVLKEFGLAGSMIGFQHEWLSVREFERLKQSLPEAGFKDFSENLWRLRNIKDAAEIDAIHKAVNIGEIGIRTALELVSTDKSEAEVSLEIESAMRSAGGQQRGIRASVLSGVQAQLPFAEPSTSRIRNDQFVVLDITVSHAGYFGNVARTIHLGRPTGKQRKLFEYVSNAALALEKRLKPQAQIKDVAEKTLKKLGRSFSSDIIVQPMGNSIGLALHEPPYIVPGIQQSVREDMVFSIYPTGFVPGTGTVKMADVVLITEDGCKNFTSLARETV